MKRNPYSTSIRLYIFSGIQSRLTQTFVPQTLRENQESNVPRFC